MRHCLVPFPTKDELLFNADLHTDCTCRLAFLDFVLDRRSTYGSTRYIGHDDSTND